MAEDIRQRRQAPGAELTCKMADKAYVYGGTVHTFWHKYRRDLGPLVALFVLPFLCFADAIFGNKTFYAWDLSLTHYPQRVFAAQMLRQGQLAFWNPYVLCGFPLLAEGQIGVLYPLNGLFALPIPSHLAFTCFIVVHYSLAGIFTYLLVRSLAVSRSGAFVAALAFALSGYLMAQLINLNIMTGSVWLPLILCCFLRAVRLRSHAWAALTGVALALQILTAQPQVVFYSLLTLGIYCCFVAGARHFQSAAHLLTILLVALAVGGGLAAPQLLPTWELKRLSLRAEGLDYETMTSFSLPLYRLIAFLFPNFLGNPVTGYIGLPFFEEHHAYIGLWPLLAAGLAWRRRKEEHVIFFLILAAVSLLLALGNQTPLYLLLRYVPGFNLFRIPARWLLVVTLSLAVLSGYGLDVLLEDEGRLAPFFKKLILVGLILAPCSAALFFFEKALLRGINYILAEVYDGMSVHVLKALVKGLTAFPQVTWSSKVPGTLWLLRAFPSLLNPLLFFWLLWIGGGVLVYLYLRGKIPRPGFRGAVLALVVFDLFLTGGTTINAVEDPSYWQARDSTLFLKENLGLHRIYPLENGRHPPLTLGHNFPTLYGIQSVGGSSSLNLQRHDDFMTALRETATLRLLNLAGVKYILTEGREPEQWEGNLRLAYGDEALHIYENLEVWPRAFVVYQAEVTDADQALNRLMSADFDPLTTIILEDREALAALEEEGAWHFGSARHLVSDSVRIIEYDPHRVVVEAELEGAGFLFLSDTFYPGWRARVDSEERRIYRANYLFRAVPLPAGRHTVEFIFTPLSFKIGLGLSFVALIAVLIAAVITRRV